MSIINGYNGKNGYSAPALDNRTPSKTSTPAGVTESAPEAASDKAMVNLSSGATAMQKLTQSLASTPAFDQAKVDRIKSLIADGQYAVDPAKIAAKFLKLEA
ncbi:MAG: flagellar biosynthesis anti-sigma factor FlgM [Halothiobacillus sp.]